MERAQVRQWQRVGEAVKEERAGLHAENPSTGKGTKVPAASSADWNA